MLFMFASSDEAPSGAAIVDVALEGELDVLGGQRSEPSENLSPSFIVHS